MGDTSPVAMNQIPSQSASSRSATIMITLPMTNIGLTRVDIVHPLTSKSTTM